MIIRLSGEVGWEILAEDVQARFDEAQGDVTLHVDSVGGDVFVGSAIYQTIKNYKGGKVTVVIGSLAASAASYFILAADEIHAYENSTMMIHEARVSAFAATSQELVSKANAVDGINKLYVDAYTARSGRSREDIALLMASETYFFGESIAEIGFADKILVDEAMSAKAENSLDFQRSRLTACKNNCKTRPLNATPPVARKELNPLAIEANKIMEKHKCLQ